jgi:hypothetical protein
VEYLFSLLIIIIIIIIIIMKIVYIKGREDQLCILPLCNENLVFLSFIGIVKTVCVLSYKIFENFF